MLKILQARLQQYVNHELPDVQAGFRKGRGTRDQIASIRWIIKKESSRKKHLFLLYWLCQSLWLCESQLKEMGIPDHLTCLLRNPYAGQEATVRTGHGTTDWFQMGKGVRHGCILSPCLLNFYAEYIMRNAGLEEAQAGIKIAGRNINNLWYADDTILMAESEEELKSLLMKVKQESEKVGLTLNIQERRSFSYSDHFNIQRINQDHGIWSHHFMENKWGNSDRHFWGGCQITTDSDCSHEIKRHILFGRKVMTSIDSVLNSRDITCQQRSV